MTGYYALHKETGKFFVGKKTQIAYTGIGYLKTAIKYKGGKLEDYKLYKLETNGTTSRVGMGE